MSTDPDSLDTATDSNLTQTGSEPTVSNPAEPITRESDALPRDDRPFLGLRSVVVTYDDRPDRRTVYPEGLSSVERMSTWFTANDGAFVDLDGAR
ncbi:DUF7511 domain-containing protein [Halorussus amylolyticus]|uniref:DUF7511 domain-containing protein n=1 Tax=Halorussus amylolyticus TaxID=1126242 RepID=UPI00104E3B09|nr:hypothetical protein [Halorussus amylolyticus]